MFDVTEAVTKWTDKKFVAWDGEGYSDDEGNHHYYLFGSSLGNYVASESLDAIECFDLLLSSPKQNHINVIFAGGYDMVMMIHKWPTVTVDRILKGKPTWYKGFRIEYFKGKYLKLSNGHRSTVLYDVFSFFSTSFVKACREYLGDSEDLDRIEAVKLQRDNFTLDSLQELVIPYWKQELIYLVELCTILRKRLNDAGIKPRQWHGPGAVAGTVLRDKGIRAHKAVTPPDVSEAARHAYYGGRFEQFMVGTHTGPVYQYDIRSAYPHAISNLRSLAGMEWKQVTNPKKVDLYGVYKISYSTTNDYDAHPFPWRRYDGAIFYPANITESWYWGVEVLAAIKHSTGTVVVHEGYVPQGNNDKPFRWIAQMYDDRAKLKKEGNPTQLALKLAMNSIYGKLAQSKGARLRDGEWKLPAYHQLEWAGWVTASTRARLYEAMMGIPHSKLIAVETDAVYALEPIPSHCATVGEQLGAWELEIYDAIMYVQSGVYFKQQHGSWKLKSRGFEPRNHTYKEWSKVMAMLPSINPDATVTRKIRRFGSVAGRDTFAKWYEMERSANILNMSSKRVHLASAEWCDQCAAGLTFADALHELYVPEFLIDTTVGSRGHRLPWIEGEGRKVFDDEELMITEDGYEILELG